MSKESKKDSAPKTSLTEAPEDKYKTVIEELLRGNNSKVFTLFKKNKLNHTLEYVCDIDGEFRGERGWCLCRYTDEAYRTEYSPATSLLYLPNQPIIFRS